MAGPVVGLVLLCIAGALLNRDFATLDNAMNVLTRTAFIGIIAVGMCFVIISGGIDLSVGSMAALIAGAVILLMNALGATAGAACRRASARLRACCSARCSASRTAC
jgi:ribose transport system permease protein